jgi:hypothetical protein
MTGTVTFVHLFPGETGQPNLAFIGLQTEDQLWRFDVEYTEAPVLGETATLSHGTDHFAQYAKA